MSENAALQSEADRFRADLAKINDEVARVIVGQQRVVEATLTALFCGGNVLLEGVPGLGKTELVKVLAGSLELEFRRIQFTPDLMPADIVGTNIMTSDETGGYRFEFRRGPIFTQLLLADEINRATPKTQSALLESMQERTVTTGGQTYRLEPPFFVLATQNPIEQEGTYPLPEAQLDRFMFKVNVPYLDRDELNEVVSRTILKRPVEVDKVMDGPRIVELGDVLQKVVVADPMRDYAVRLTLSTHPDSPFASETVRKFVRWGGSPRAPQSLIRAARVRALSEGRAHVAFEDIRHFAVEVLQHRVLLNYDGQAENLDVAELIVELINHVKEDG
ncbi:MAG: AAA family ATPase [Phycisphaeraceae bacterium]|nr:AAA family ATPase [Phycisphaeraceae bacterium]